MLAASWAFTYAQAFGKLVLSVFAYIVSVTLALVAGLAEMSVSPAEPLSNAAAKLAFELNEVFSMLRAIVYWYFAAIRANKLLGIE